MQSFRRAVYGSIVIPRGLCPNCHDGAFVIGGQFACCGLPVDETEVARSQFERMSSGGYKRHTPSLVDRRRILSAQDNRCFYCGTVFGDIAACPGRDPRMLRPVWDHVEPFAWQANNQLLNFVAACSVCNGIKGSRMFESKEAARIYVWHRRKVKGWATATETHPESGQEVRG